MAGDLMLDARPLPSGPLIVPAQAAAEEVFLSLVIPTFNERENVREFLEAARRVLDRAIPGRYELIVVDDDSPDRTWEIAAGLPDFPQLRVVRRLGERGLASAVIRGWQVARGSVLGTINADFQHPPEVLPAMVEAIAGADVVVASRYVEGGSVGNWRWFRRLTSKAAHGLGRLLLPQVFGRISDPLSGCYLARRAAIAGVELRPLGYKTLMEIAVRGRAERIRECPYQMRDRARGHSKAGMRQTFQYIGHLFRLRRAAR
jgi:dolichol-phosphate mannosyltransferase